MLPTCFRVLPGPSTGLECMMQDYPKSLGADAVVGFTVFDNWVGYSPVKNSPADGADKFKAGAYTRPLFGST